MHRMVSPRLRNVHEESVRCFAGVPLVAFINATHSKEPVVIVVHKQADIIQLGMSSSESTPPWRAVDIVENLLVKVAGRHVQISSLQSTIR